MSSTVYLPKTELYPYSRQWNLLDLWRLSEDLPITEMSVSKLWDDMYSKVWCWQNEDEVINNEFFLHHMKRVLDADLNYSIILSEENYIFDGVHRLMKCKYLEIETVSCVQFTKDPLSNSDQSELEFLKKLQKSRKAFSERTT
jgi:hypothetical protein